MTYTPPHLPIWTTIVKAVDEDVASSTTEQDDDELFFAVSASTIYAFEMEIIYSNAAGSAPDLKFHITGPTSSLGAYHAVGLSTTDTTQHTAGAVGSAPGAITFGAGVLRRLVIVHTGSVLIDSTSGNVRFRWCQNTSNVTATRVHAGSIMRWRRVAAAS